MKDKIIKEIISPHLKKGYRANVFGETHGLRVSGCTLPDIRYPATAKFPTFAFFF
jgi:hypothetical protein